MNIPNLITRLMNNRPLSFVDKIDTYLLKTGEEGNGGFEKIGTQ